ncbi:MAG: DUF2163 domain-containing protein [Alphaproteobacteria bacterium]|nr:DUF2163 domain-containing protein [Alphaproteobacteria bacterium]
MLKLDLTNKPAWLDLGHGVRVLLGPLTTAMMVAARNDPAVQALPEDASDEISALAFAKVLAHNAALDWKGVGDHDLPLSFDGITFAPESGFAASEIRSGSDLAVDSQDAVGVLTAITITTSTEGAIIPRIYGRMWLGGNIIWATDFSETVNTTSQGGKGGGPKVTTTSYLYTASFAVALAEGPVIPPSKMGGLPDHHFPKSRGRPMPQNFSVEGRNKGLEAMRRVSCAASPASVARVTSS